MSNFPGRMREYKSISLDRFNGDNLQSTVYFLSHCHKDHMVGLDLPGFLYRMQNNSDVKLYCSGVTRDLLLVTYPDFKSIQRSIVALTVDTPHIINIPDQESGKSEQQVTITLLHAGHCPGSVMVLIEGGEGTVLYTGDFRLHVGDIARIEHLHSGGRVKTLDSLYLDSTFCVPQCLYIPTREQSVDKIFDIVQEWIGQSPNHMILLNYKASLGYEHIFSKLHERFKMKVHLSQAKFEQVQAVHDLRESGFGTNNPVGTQIHACRWMSYWKKGCALPCGYQPSAGSNVHVRVITVSTMWFTNRDDMAKVVQKNERFRVCYSFHSSYSEIRDMVTHLRPHRVFPNVVPMGCDQDKIQKRLDEFLHSAKAMQPPSQPLSQEFKPLGRQRKRKRRSQNIYSQKNSQGSDDGLFFEEEDFRSPLKKKRSQVLPSTKNDVHSSPVFKVVYSDDDAEPTSSIRINTRSSSESDAESTDKENSFTDEDEEGNDDDYTKYLNTADLEELKHSLAFDSGSYGDHVTYVSEDDDDVDNGHDKEETPLEKEARIREESTGSTKRLASDSSSVELIDYNAPLYARVDSDTSTIDPSSQNNRSDISLKELEVAKYSASHPETTVPGCDSKHISVSEPSPLRSCTQTVGGTTDTCDNAKGKFPKKTNILPEKFGSKPIAQVLPIQHEPPVTNSKSCHTEDQSHDTNGLATGDTMNGGTVHLGESRLSEMDGAGENSETTENTRPEVLQHIENVLFEGSNESSDLEITNIEEGNGQIPADNSEVHIEEITILDVKENNDGILLPHSQQSIRSSGSTLDYDFLASQGDLLPNHQDVLATLLPAIPHSMERTTTIDLTQDDVEEEDEEESEFSDNSADYHTDISLEDEDMTTEEHALLLAAQDRFVNGQNLDRSSSNDIIVLDSEDDDEKESYSSVSQTESVIDLVEQESNGSHEIVARGTANNCSTSRPHIHTGSRSDIDKTRNTSSTASENKNKINQTSPSKNSTELSPVLFPESPASVSNPAVTAIPAKKSLKF